MISLGTLINQGALVHRESEDGGLKSRGFSLRMGTLTKSGTLFAPMSPLSYAHPPSGNLPGMEFWENRKFHNLGEIITRKHDTPTKLLVRTEKGGLRVSVIKHCRGIILWGKQIPLIFSVRVVEYHKSRV